MIPVRLLIEAEDDLAEAAAFLDKRLPGLGLRLTAEVDHAIVIRLFGTKRAGRDKPPGPLLR